jgi:Cys-rich four helix bundle protein (predicted Tat secretion target)
MNRRDAVFSLAAAVSVVPSIVLGADKVPAAKPPAAAAATPSYEAVITACEHCVQTGEDCFELAITLLKKGDQTMAECADTTRAMRALCETVAQLGRMGSPHTKAAAAVCAKACRDCEKACRKHETHHAECKACAESCAHCAAECEKLAA